MTRMTTTLLLAALLAACGGAQDETGRMMDDGSDMAADSTQMNGAMDSQMMEDNAMDESSIDDAVGNGTPMSRDTSEMRRP